MPVVIISPALINFPLLISLLASQQIEFKGQKIISDIFAAFESDPLRLLPLTRQEVYKQALEQGETGYRQLCDYISSMTDEYAIKVHGRLFTTEY